MKDRAKGFTLIEIMLVIAVISILILIQAGHFMKSRYRGQYAACQQNIRSIGVALETYATDNKGKYPSLTNFDALFRRTSDRPPYITPKLFCPSDESNYGYLVNENIGDYTIYCNGVHWQVIDTAFQGFPQYSGSKGLLLMP